MKVFFGHIAVLAASVIVLLPSCRKDDAEVIPRSELSRIYAEMLLTDQWILNTPNVRTIADTSLVYEPILEKYGYDADDYRKSVDVYMDDPERFAKIFRETSELLSARLDELHVEKERLKLLEQLRKEAEKFRPDTKWEMTKESYDSLVVEMDSSTWTYRFVRIARKDTVTVENLSEEVIDTTALTPVIEKIDTLVSKAELKKMKLQESDFRKMSNVSK